MFDLHENFTHSSFGKGDRALIRDLSSKLKESQLQKRVKIHSEIEKFQSPYEVSEKEINIRNLKLFLRCLCNTVTSYEMDNLIHALDRDNTGFVSI